MRKTIFLLIAVFLFFGITLQKAFADVTLDISPAEVKLGELVTITINGIPNGTATYTISEGHVVSQRNLDRTNVLTLKVFDTGSCIPDGTRNNNVWKEITCNLDSSGNSFIFTTKIDTNHVDAKELNTNSSVQYGVAFIQPGQRTPLFKEFTIKADSTSTTPTFDFDQQNPLSPSPAEPGDQLSIKINVNNEGNFIPHILSYTTVGNSAAKSARGASNRCATGSCILTIQIPNNIKNSSLQIAVEDFNGYKKTTTLQINNPNATPTISSLQVTTTPFPTSTPVPSPTPVPPLFPCNTYVDVTDTNKKIPAEELKQLIESERIKNPEYVDRKYQCDTVSTAVGSIPTDPAKFIRTIFTILLSMSGGWAVYLIITAGYMLMFSQGDAEGVKEAREKITSAVVGLIFMLLSLVVLRVIGVDIFALPTFK